MVERSGAVSVVIPHYGDPEPAASLVDQLREQKGVAAIQIIIVDDASPQPFPPMNDALLVRRDSNGGFGAAVNTGAALATHPLLLVLNSDLEIGPTVVRDLVAAAEPWQPTVASPQVIGHNGAPQWAGRHFPRTRHYVVEWLTPLARYRTRPSLHEAVGHDTRCTTGATIPVDWVIGAALLMPLDHFRAVGGFDESFHMNCEEVDLQNRLRQRGIPAMFLGTVTVTHEGGGSSDPGKRRRWLVSSRLHYAQKWHDGPTRQRLALTGASLVNFTVNLGRQLAGRPLRATTVLREELGYLWERA